MLFLDLSNLEIILSCSKYKNALLTPVFSSLYNFFFFFIIYLFIFLLYNIVLFLPYNNFLNNYKTVLLPLLLNSVTLNNINNYFLLIKFSFCVCINIPFHTFFLPVFLRYNWQIALHKLKVYTIMIWLTSWNVYYSKFREYQSTSHRY